MLGVRTKLYCFANVAPYVRACAPPRPPPPAAAVPIARELQELGFGIMATYNTAAHLRKAGLTNIQSVLKVQEGRPNAGGFCAASDKPA